MAPAALKKSHMIREKLKKAQATKNEKMEAFLKACYEDLPLVSATQKLSLDALRDIHNRKKNNS